jgi:CubicO group peptidase (beta-lactamase class C family)
VSLSDYFQKHTFEPMGITDITTSSNAQMKKDLAFLKSTGGAGCFACPAENCQIITMLPNNGTHARNGAQILKPKTVQEMFTNQITEMPYFGRQIIDPPKRLLSNLISDLYPQPPEMGPDVLPSPPWSNQQIWKHLLVGRVSKFIPVGRSR